MKILKYLSILFLSHLLMHFPIQHLVSLGLLQEGINNSHLKLGWDIYTVGIFYYLVIFFPFFEETSFRLFLKPTKNRLLFGVSFLSTLIVYLISSHYIDLDSQRFIYTSLTILLSVSLFILLNKKLNVSSQWQSRINSKYLLIASSVGFALVHYGVYFSSHIVLFSFIPLIKHFFSGLIFGIIRIRHGFRYGLLLHSSNNLLAFLAIFFKSTVLT
ncbi:CPBP family intramembrane metalloprotease [Litoribacter ruber]|nr:CPBP family intramembrane metalloprotease [Litoribacter ruber]